MSRTFLLIDSDKPTRSAMAAVLRRSGHIVLEAGSGTQATSALEMCAPDYIVMDGQMPDADGLRWIERHRGLCPGVRFIFTSAFWQDHAVFQRLQGELKVVLVLPKPFSEAEFEERLHSVLRPARRAGAAATTPGMALPRDYPPGPPARAA